MRETIAAGGVVLRGDLVLVVSQWGTSWSLPKGHPKEGETRLEAARREILEESGIKELELVKELGNYKRFAIDENAKEDKNELKTIFFYLFSTKQAILNPTDPMTPEAKWVHKDEVADVLSHPKDKEFFLSVSDEL